MPIVKQGEQLPPWNSMSDDEQKRLSEELESVLSTNGRGIKGEIIAIRSIGNRGDQRSYDATVFLNIPEGLILSTSDIAGIATRVVNEIDGLGRVLVDITPKK